MKDEPRHLPFFRFILYIIIILAYLLYLCYLIYNVVTDKPNLKVDQIFLNEVDVPDIIICGASSELRILRCDFIKSNKENQQNNDCNNYVLPNLIDYGIYRDNCLTFKANKTIKFVKPESGIDGLQKIGFYFYDNRTAAEMNTLGISSLTIQLTHPDFNFNSLTNSNNAISQMDKATLSEFKLQLNFIAGMANYVAVVKFKTSTYRSILPDDSSAIFGLSPDYHVTPKIESFINYFPFNSNPFNVPVGTTGYFSIAAGSFIQEQTTEERSNTILSALAAAGGAFGVMAGTLVFFFGDSPLSPWGFVHKIGDYIKYPINLYKRSKFYEHKLKFSKIDGNDKSKLEGEFDIIRYAINYYLLYQYDIKEISEVGEVERWNENKSDENKHKSIFRKSWNWLSNKFYRVRNIFNRIKVKIYYGLLSVSYTEERFNAYRGTRTRNLNFEIINEKDQKLLNDEFNKIRHVIDIYVLDELKVPKIFAKYKYERELKFSDNMNEIDKKLLNDEFYKIRKLIDKHLLGLPNIQEIFEIFNSDQNNQEFNFSDKMNKKDKDLFKDKFLQIRHVIYNHLLDIPKVDKEFNKYNDEPIIKRSRELEDDGMILKVDKMSEKSDQELSFSDNMDEEDEKLFLREFDRIKHVIDSHLFGERKSLRIYKRYKMERKLMFSNNIDEKDKKLLNDEFRKIRHLIVDFLLNEPKVQTVQWFSINMDENDTVKLLNNLSSECYSFRDDIDKIKNDIDNYILDQV